MTIVNKKYEFVIEENKVYRIKPVSFFNAPKSIQMTGTGTVDLLGSIQEPSNISDPILTTQVENTNLAGFYTIDNAMPNFVKLIPNQAGSRIITLSGFEIEEITF